MAGAPQLAMAFWPQRSPHPVPRADLHARRPEKTKDLLEGFPRLPLDDQLEPSHARRPSACSMPPCATELQGLYRQTCVGRKDLLPFGGPAGQRRLVDCIVAGSAAAYFPLAEQFVTQSRPPLCGPATIAMVLNSLAIDPRRVWKAPWRWFSEDMLLACVPFDWSNGINLEQFAHLVECNGALARPFTAGGPHAGLQDFRNCIRRACSPQGAETSRVAINFSRARLGQTGDAGHFSPIAAYHEGMDAVLVMDVARFKYPPFWAPVPLIWEAMTDIDPSTGCSRGYVEVCTVQAVADCTGPTKGGSGAAGAPSATASSCPSSCSLVAASAPCSLVAAAPCSSRSSARWFRQFLAIDAPISISRSLRRTQGPPAAADLLSCLVSSMLSHSDAVSPVTRPLSHRFRKRTIEDPDVVASALSLLRRVVLPRIEYEDWINEELMQLWPAHPQKSLELTTLLGLVCVLPATSPRDPRVPLQAAWDPEWIEALRGLVAETLTPAGAPDEHACASLRSLLEDFRDALQPP